MTELDPQPRDPAARPAISFRSGRVGGAGAGCPLAVLAALIATLTVMVVIAELPAPVAPVVAPSAPAAPTPGRQDPSPASSAEPTEPGVPLAGTVVRVVSGVVGPGLQGQHLYVAAGPVNIGTPAVPSLLVQHWGDLARGLDMDTTFAWVPSKVVAAGTAPVSVPCPASVESVLDITALDPFERLVCFGGRTLTFGPTITSRLTAGARTSDRWLTQDAHSDVLTALPFYDIPGVSAIVPDHAWVRVSGHFDDPSSAGCGGLTDIIWCRQRFVVTDVVPVDSPFLAGDPPSARAGAYRGARPARPPGFQQGAAGRVL